MIDKQKLQSRLEGRPATKPWSREETKPWRPDFMRLKSGKPGFRPRWVRKDRVEQMVMQGWTVANRKDYDPGEAQNVAQSDGLATTIERNELILMELPEERAKAREAHYEAINRRQEEDGKARVKEAARKLRGEHGLDVQLTDES